MKYSQSWQDFMRQPEMMQLKESKGIFACKQKYIQEQNKMMWADPMIINEGAQDAGVTNNANAADGGSTSFVTGNDYEVTTFSFASTADGHWTGSQGANPTGAHNDTNWYFDVEAYNGATDFTAGHTDSYKTFRFFVTSGSYVNAGFAPTIPNGIDGVVTASAVHIGTDHSLAADDVNITGSILGQFVRAIKDQGATDIVGGFTNTIAPNTLFTAITGSTAGAGTLTITNKYKGSCADATISSLFSSTTASIATTTAAKDTWYDDQGANTFNDELPFSNYPRKASGTTTSQPS